MTDLPSGWAIGFLPQMVGSGGVFSDGDWVESKDQDPDGEVRLIQLADVGDGRYRDRSSRFLTLSKARDLGCTFLQTGDVLIARMPDPLGRACIFPGDPKTSVTVVDVCVIRPGSGSVNPRWLMYALNAPQSRSAMEALQKGTTRRRVSRGNLAVIPFPLPPTAEQERIVAAVEEEFSRLDAGVAALAQSRDCLAVLESATLELLLTRGSDPGAVWKTRELSDLTAPGKSSIKAGPFGSALKKSCYSSSGYKIYGQEQVIKGDARYGDYYIDSTKYAELATCAVKAGDVLVSLVGSYGKCLVLPEDAEPGIINPRLVKITVDKTIIDPYFLQLVVQSPVAQRYFEKRAYGQTMGILNTKILRSLPVPLPELEQQHAVIVEWRALSESLLRLRQAIGAIGKREQTLRSSILASAFAGTLVPQDPTDEPASALLERITAERASSNGHNPTRTRKPRTKVNA
jgi:type I restriction enzyme S subunit